MSWEPLRLAVNTAGSEYGENNVRVADLLKQMSSVVSEDSRPAVVWFYRPSQDDMNQSIEANVFQNEQVGTALQMFRRYRVNVLDIADSRIREEYENTPAFQFFDPAGEHIFTLDGRKVDSLSTFDSVVEKVWRTVFKTRLRNYQRGMKRILDQLDKLDGRKQILEQNQARLAEDARPNPRKQRELEREAKELEELAKKIEEEEQELQASIELREKYLPDDDEVANRD